MGQILEDMTKASRERIEKYQVNPDNVENDEESQNLEEARERGDWLYSSLKPPARLTCSRARLQTVYCSTRNKSKRRTIFPK